MQRKEKNAFVYYLIQVMDSCTHPKFYNTTCRVLDFIVYYILSWIKEKETVFLISSIRLVADLSSHHDDTTKCVVLCDSFHRWHSFVVVNQFILHVYFLLCRSNRGFFVISKHVLFIVSRARPKKHISILTLTKVGLKIWRTETSKQANSSFEK